ncbi:MAG: hypothetical protein Q7J85_03180 [Bacillota bacterium]|nr:hypothetical protein [Bacillota bacterium]
MSIIKVFRGTNHEFRAWLKTWPRENTEKHRAKDSKIVNLTIYRSIKKMRNAGR